MVAGGELCLIRWSTVRFRHAPYPRLQKEPSFPKERRGINRVDDQDILGPFVGCSTPFDSAACSWESFSLRKCAFIVSFAPPSSETKWEAAV